MKVHVCKKEEVWVELSSSLCIRGRILDLSIQYPGLTSHCCLAFKGMSLFQRLVEEGILDLMLCIFGDSTNLNTPYLAMPNATVSSGTKDVCNHMIILS